MKTLLILVLSLFLNACGSVEIPDFKAYITLPASGDGYWVKTVSTDEGQVAKADWESQRRHGIVILSEDWKTLRYTILKNCLTMSCKNAVGTFDNLFNTLDGAIKKIDLQTQSSGMK